MAQLMAMEGASVGGLGIAAGTPTFAYFETKKQELSYVCTCICYVWRQRRDALIADSVRASVPRRPETLR